MEVEVCHMIDPVNFVLRPKSRPKRHAEMEAALQTSPKALLTLIRKGQLLALKFEGFWLRARLESDVRIFNGIQRAKFSLVDRGFSTDWTPLKGAVAELADDEEKRLEPLTRRFRFDLDEDFSPAQCELDLNAFNVGLQVTYFSTHPVLLSSSTRTSHPVQSLPCILWR